MCVCCDVKVRPMLCQWPLPKKKERKRVGKKRQHSFCCCYLLLSCVGERSTFPKHFGNQSVPSSNSFFFLFPFVYMQFEVSSRKNLLFPAIGVQKKKKEKQNKLHLTTNFFRNCVSHRCYVNKDGEIFIDRLGLWIICGTSLALFDSRARRLITQSQCS